MENIIGLKDLRENVNKYVEQINQGKSFMVLKRSKPIFKICPINETDSKWEEVVDFTKIKKGGVDIDEVLSRL